MAVFAQTEMKYGNKLFLNFVIEVDEDVAARDQVHFREWRIVQEVVRSEHHQIPDFVIEPVAVIVPGKELSQALLGNLGADAEGEKSLAGFRQALGAGIRGEDRDRR